MKNYLRQLPKISPLHAPVTRQVRFFWSALCAGLVVIFFPLSMRAESESSRPLFFVENGKAVGEFVVDEDISQVETFGVTDIRHWIQEITGAKVPILRSPSAKENTKVFVGKKYASEFKEDLAKLADNDGFAIRRKGRDVFVFGNRPRATMYGLFAFLEKNSDIIWARPNQRFGTIFGRSKDLPLTATDWIDIPVFNYRSFAGGHPGHIPTGEWQLRNRNNQCGRLYGPEMDMLNTIGTNLGAPVADLFLEHPEYFAYYPATKERRPVRHGEGSLCITHPDLPEAWARGLLNMVEEKEKKTGAKVTVVKFAPGDNWYCCQCPECMKPIKLPDGTTLEMKDPSAEIDPLFRSTQIYQFLNEAMKTLVKERPDIQFAALAYIHMAEPPLVKLHPKMGIQFAPYSDNSMHFPLLDPRQVPRWRERFEKWLGMTDSLGFYEYWFSKPSPQGFYAAENLRALLKTKDHSNAVLYTLIDNDRFHPLEGGSMLGWDLGGMNPWVIAQLFWNPNQDVDELYRYYIKRTFREAAPEMTEYYEMIKGSWLDPEDKTVDAAHAGMRHIYQNMIVAKRLEPKLMDILRRAEAAAKNPDSQRLIKRMREGYAGFTDGLSRLIVADIPEMAHDGDRFASVQWGKPQPLNEFMVPSQSRLGKPTPPSQETIMKAAQDGKNLYLRFTVTDSKIAQIQTVEASKDIEIFPKGDHIEFWLRNAETVWLLAFDANGTMYDAKNHDRSWDSEWRLKVEKNNGGYEAIAIIPLETFGLAGKQDTKLQWFCSREINHIDEKTEKVSYKGSTLYRKYYPIWMQ